MKKPLIFISYAGAEVELADFVKKYLQKMSNDALDVFIARRDISSGKDPLKTMLDEKLKNADAIIPICSKNSKESPWVWWESASVWAKTGKVHPLFTNISASNFGAPLILVVQGKEYFIKEEFFETLETICKNLGINFPHFDFDPEEEKIFLKLKEKFSPKNVPGVVRINFDKLIIEQDYHKYSLNYELQNGASAAFNDVTLDLFFPEKYLIRKEWNYTHLSSPKQKDNPEYVCLTFDFKEMPETAIKQFSRFLLPGKTLRIFGKDGITKLEYEMDDRRWVDIHKYMLSYKLYIDRGTPQEDSFKFSEFQCY